MRIRLSVARKRWGAVVAGLGACLCGCQLFSRSPVASPLREPLGGGAMLAPAQSVASFGQALNGVEPATVSPQLAWALSQCRCAGPFWERYLEGSLLRTGVVPEVLVPAIRQEIRTNPRIRLLQGLSGPLGGLLEQLFVSESTLLKEIRGSIREKIRSATGWSVGLPQPFRFSLFAPAEASLPANGWATRFSVAEQTLRWNAVLAPETLWRSESPVSRSEPSVLLLPFLVMLAEWQYAFGLAKDEASVPFGGLTLALGQPELAPFDPRIHPNEARFLSGEYEIRIPSGSALDTALRAREVWTHQGGAVTLDEQARLWITAARAFSRLRQAGSGPAAGVFRGAAALVPEDASSLPLVFLPSLRELLKSRFIEESSRRIFVAFEGEERSLSGGDGATGRLRALARLLQALRMWNVELRNLDSLEISPELKTELQEAPEALKRAMQLVVQTLLQEFVRSRGEAMEFRTGDGVLPRAAAAESLLSLAEAERDVLPSPLLRRHVVALARGFLNSEKGAPVEMDGESLIWLVAFFSRDSLEGIPEGADFRTALTKVVEQWSARF